MATRPKMYIETTIPSYLAAWPSRDLVTAANQQTTRDWWETQRERFDLYFSQVVVQESAAGDPQASQRRLAALEDLLELEVSDEARSLAEKLLRDVPLPPNADLDALHVAISAVHGMDYLLTWNCTHIANAVLRHKIESVCRAAGFEPPVICTPHELMEI